MNNVVETVRSAIGGIFSVLVSVVGLLVLAQVVIANLQTIVNGFVGEGASLAGLITLLLVVALLQKQSSNSE